MISRHDILIFFLTFFLFNGAFAQKTYISLSEAPKSVVSKYEKASKISLHADAEKKKTRLEKIISKEPILIEALVDLARVAYYQKDYELAEKYILEAIENTSEKSGDLYNVYAGICKAKEDFTCEKENLKEYLVYEQNIKKRKRAERRIDKLMQMEMIIENAEPVELEMLSYHINSEEYAEYKPVLSTNDSTIIFTRRINSQEDFYQSDLKENGWTKAREIAELNTPGNEGAHAISPDGKYMIFTKCDAPNRYRSCDLYISKKKDGKWGEAKYMGITNTESWESQAAFSADGKTIYFSSSREGGIGGKDIYKISLIDGKWGEVKNLGKEINTPGNEESPYIHPDGRTMYFMSTGHPGLGGYDLFITHKKQDGSWTKPKNMGPSINSVDDEGGIFVDRQGKFAYFSKTKKMEKSLSSDIYRFPLPQKFKPTPVSYIQLKVVDAATNEALSANLIIKKKKETNSRELKISTDGLTEIISPDETYELTVEKEGYLFYSENINPAFKNNINDPLVLVIKLQAIPTENTETPSAEIVLRNIYFETGKARLLSSSYTELDRLVNLLKEQKNKEISIFGHTDDVGTEKDNLLLSQNRADAVKNYLIKMGIEDRRITTIALGESQPIADNSTAEGKAKNRRIAFRLN